MIKVVDSIVMAEIDRISIEKYGMSSDILMEQAGLRLSDIIDSVCREKGFRQLTCLVGSGHNGGDGLVISRHLSEKYKMEIIVCGKGKSVSWLSNEKILRNFGASIIEIPPGKTPEKSLIGKTDCIIDCLSGTGLNSAPRTRLCQIIDIVNSVNAFKISVDIPSGLFSSFDGKSSAVKSDMTLYINLPKISFFSEAGRKFCGRLVRTEIGFPEKVIKSAEASGNLADESIIQEFYSRGDAADYKNKKGHAAVFAGKPGTSGAAVLACGAAGKSGCGLVTLYTSAETFPLVAPAVPSVMCRSSDMFSDKDLDKFSSFCAGPGWGSGKIQEKISAALIKSNLCGIIDADAVDFFAGYLSESVPEKLRFVFTPHPGEFRRIYNIVFGRSPGPDTVAEVRKTAEKLNSVIVYKNSFTIIAVPGTVPFIVDGMFPALAVAGSGDVLAGIICGFLARGFRCADAGLCAVLFHLKAAKALYNKSGVFNSEQLCAEIGLVTALYETK